MQAWRNWQTRTVQVRVRVTSWRFESSCLHQIAADRFGLQCFYIQKRFFYFETASCVRIVIFAFPRLLLPFSTFSYCTPMRCFLSAASTLSRILLPSYTLLHLLAHSFVLYLLLSSFTLPNFCHLSLPPSTLTSVSRFVISFLISHQMISLLLRAVFRRIMNDTSLFAYEEKA